MRRPAIVACGLPQTTEIACWRSPTTAVAAFKAKETDYVACASGSKRWAVRWCATPRQEPSSYLNSRWWRTKNIEPRCENWTQDYSRSDCGRSGDDPWCPGHAPRDRRGYCGRGPG